MKYLLLIISLLFISSCANKNQILAKNVKPPKAIPSEYTPAIPRRITNPYYPDVAIKNKNEGHVSFLFDINTDGVPINIQVYDMSHRIFVRAAQRAIRRWHFKPVLKNGIPVLEKYYYIMKFKLNS